MMTNSATNVDEPSQRMYEKPSVKASAGMPTAVYLGETRVSRRSRARKRERASEARA